MAGVFHGDPHPGNLFVLADGRICMHDFGLVGFLDKATRLNLAAFMRAFTEQDGDWLLDAYLDLGLLGGRPDRARFRAGLEEMIQDYARLPLRDWSFGTAFLRLARIGRGQNLRLPHHLLLMLRAVFLMESTVRRLDPDFNLLEGLFKRAENTLAPRLHAPDLDELAARLQFEGLLALEAAPTNLRHLLARIRAGAVGRAHRIGRCREGDLPRRHQCRARPVSAGAIHCGVPSDAAQYRPPNRRPAAARRGRLCVGTMADAACRTPRRTPLIVASGHLLSVKDPLAR